MKKRLVSILCAAAMLMSMVVMPANAEDTSSEITSGSCGDNLTCVLTEDGTLTISGSGAMESYTQSNYDTTPWFEYRESVKSVIIESGVTSISDFAFYYCTAMESITIPDSVESIGNRAFYSCSSLTGITIPDSVTSIGKYTFYGCSALTEISIPGSVTSIGAGAFSNCTGLVSVALSSGVTTIGEQAFASCSSLTSITIPDTVTSLGASVFKNCSSLTDIYYGGSQEEWESISSGSGIDDLTSVTVHYNSASDDSTTDDDGTTDDTDDDTTDDGTTDGGTTDDGTTDDGSTDDDSTESTAVASGTFGSELTLTWTITENIASDDDTAYTLTISGSGAIPDYEKYTDCPWTNYCTKITSVVIESGVTYIGSNSIRSFSALTSVSLPDTLTGIGSSAFYNCAVLPEISLHSGLTEIGDSAFAACTKLDGIVIPDTVTTIGAYAFSWCVNLTAVSVPESVTSVGEYAFNNCWKLAEAVLNCSITEIKESTFYCCSSLSTITIPDTVISIGEKAFGNCTALTSIYLPAGITAIGYAAFYNCTSLTDVYYAGSETEWSVISIGLSNTCLTGADIHYNYAETLDSGSFGDALTWTLSGDGVLTISGTGDMPDFSSEEEIPWYAYRESITSVVIESGVTSIDDLAFAGCTALTAITIPASVVSIDSEAFVDCDALTEIDYEGTNIDWILLLVEIPNGDAVIACSGGEETILASGTCGDTAYWLLTEGGALIIYGEGETGFTTTTTTIISTSTSYSISISSVTSIPWAAYADSILSVEIREGITLLDANAFQDCTNLASVSLPLSLTEICADAFDGCTALYTVTYAGTAEDWAAIKIADGNDILTAAYAGTRAAGTCGEALTWTLADGILTISGTGEMTSYAVYEELPWYKYRSLITSVVIEEGVTTLSAYAFFGCTALTSAGLPETLTEIGAYAFYLCLALTDLTIPAGITSIGESAFRGCIALSAITFEGDAPSIGENAFSGVTAAVYYPADNNTWTDEVMLDYGGSLTWTSYSETVFEDVEEGTWYYDAVYWALENGITKGTSETTFSPDLSVTRAQLVTFLYRLAGSPSVDVDNPFEDVNETDYADYYDAILWAYCVGVTTGKNTAETFCPDDAVTRAEIATFLWRYYGEQVPDEITEEFLDVTDQSVWYYEAVYWAYQNGITLGMSETELIFSPETVCTRAQFVTFLYRAENAG